MFYISFSTSQIKRSVFFFFSLKMIHYLFPEVRKFNELFYDSVNRLCQIGMRVCNRLNDNYRLNV